MFSKGKDGVSKVKHGEKAAQSMERVVNKRILNEIREKVTVVLCAG